MKEISFNYKKNKFNIRVRECKGLHKILGLMFKSRDADALFFNFNKQTNTKIHSFFVFFPFVAIWLDERNNLVDIKKVKPFTFSTGSRKTFNKLIEIPLNKRYLYIIKKLKLRTAPLSSVIRKI